MKKEFEVVYWVDEQSDAVVGWCEEVGIGALATSLDQIGNILKANIVNALTEYGTMGDPGLVNDIITIGEEENDS